MIATIRGMTFTGTVDEIAELARKLEPSGPFAEIVWPPRDNLTTGPTWQPLTVTTQDVR